VLLAIYFFLAGCVVSQSRMLWVMPAASAVFACILASIAAASSLLSSAYRCTISTTLMNTCAMRHLHRSYFMYLDEEQFLWDIDG
jgi:hypothetical protein